MKKNNLLILLSSIISLTILSACADKGPEDPLILPPNFAEMPDVNKTGKDTAPKAVDPDNEKLRELLLKGN
jgi:predicted small lipoprotein YifL